jgi:hypothetical protein
MKDLELYSDPTLVLEAGRNMGYIIAVSTRKDKKYMVLRPDWKWVHFGQMGYADFTKHNDEKRRDSFWKRNWRWASADRYTPAYLSFHLLW